MAERTETHTTTNSDGNVTTTTVTYDSDGNVTSTSTATTGSVAFQAGTIRNSSIVVR